MKTITKFLRVNRKDISFLKYVFEAWEGLAIISTMDAQNGIIAVIMAPQSRADAEMVIEELARKILIEEISEPESIKAASRLDLFDTDRYG